MKRRLSVFLLVLLLVLCLVPTAMAEETQDSEAVTWSYENGTLTIFGTGAMEDYVMVGTPWNGHRDSITAIVVEEGVTAVGTGAFVGYSELLYVVLPESLESVNPAAFTGSRSLCHVLYQGEDREDVTISLGNAMLENAVWHCGSDGSQISGSEDCVAYYVNCSACEEAIHTETKAEPEHSFGQWEVTTPATTEAEGEETRTCTACGETETQSIEKLPEEEKKEDGKPALENPFVDVQEDAYYYDAVLWAYDYGVTQGKDATHFLPKEDCTRAQFVTFLWRSMGSPEPRLTVNPFKDVSEDAYYYKAVLWAVENGVTTGKTLTTFQPSGICTRAQVVTFLWRYYGRPLPASWDNPFNDLTNKDAFYYAAVLWAVEEGITTGKTATTFQPSASCTRSQNVTFLYRALVERD